MKKTKLIKIVALIAVIAFSFSLAACSGLPIVNAAYDGDSDGTYKPLGNIIMNAGETLTISRSNFEGVDSNVKSDWSVGEFDRFELFVSNESHDGVVTIKDNIITAANSGYTTVDANVYIKGRDPSGKRVMLKWTVRVAEIHVINEATMTPITTAQELADMNNDLSGNYILKAEIDLANWGEWESIGRPLILHETSFGFEGMLVNPHGYKIKNLTITTSKERISGAALFNFLGGNALVSGIILEDIFINVSDYEDNSVASLVVGGIAVETHNWVRILDCTVNGTIIGGSYYTGGIVGVNQGFIISCSFKGMLKVNKEINYASFAIGGIAGFNMTTRENIIGCTVNANVDGGEWACAGGIIGYNSAIKMVNNSFEGAVTGRQAGTMIGFDKFSNESPVDFD